MNLAATKIELAQQILSTENKSLIKQVKALFEKQENEWFEELPDAVKKSIEISLKQSERGETISHTEVMKKFRKWIKK